MPGMRVASTDEAGWSVETVELALTGRTHRRGGRAVPIGDGAQLLVRRHGSSSRTAPGRKTWGRWAWICPAWPWWIAG